MKSDTKITIPSIPSIPSGTDGRMGWMFSSLKTKYHVPLGGKGLKSGYNNRENENR